MPYNRQLYYYLSFIIIYKLNKGVMFIDTTVYYSLYIIIYKLTKGVPTPNYTFCLVTRTTIPPTSSYNLLLPQQHPTSRQSSTSNIILTQSPYQHLPSRNCQLLGNLRPTKISYKMFDYLPRTRVCHTSHSSSSSSYSLLLLAPSSPSTSSFVLVCLPSPHPPLASRGFTYRFSTASVVPRRLSCPLHSAQVRLF